MTEGNLQKDWKELKLTELVSKEKYSIRRGPFGGAIKKEIFVPDGYKIYEQKNAIYDDMTLGNYFIDEKKYQELEGFAVQPGDFIISCSGTIGKIAIIPSDAKPGIINQALLKITPNPKVIDSKFFKWLLESPQIQRQMFGFASGSSIKNVKPLNEIRQTKFLVPELGEQRRIAAVLDKADALRQKRRAALARLDTLLQATFLHMFGDPVTNPMGWEEMELFDTADKFSDGPFGSNLKTEHYTESGIQVIRLQNIGVGYLDESDKAFISEEHYQSLPRHHCIPGDIVVGTLGDPNLRATIIPQHIDRCLNKADCVQYRVNSKIMNKDYACWLLNNPNIIKRASALSLGQTRLRISMGRLKGLIVPVPPLEKQKTFSVYYQRFAIEKNAQVENLGLLDNLFHALQQRAFSGQL